MEFLWLLSTWMGLSALTYFLLKHVMAWTVGRLAFVSAMVPPVGLLVYMGALWWLVRVTQTLTAGMSLFVPGTAAAVVLALLLRALGARAGSWQHWGLVLMLLFIASTGPFLLLMRIASRAIHPGW